MAYPMGEAKLAPLRVNFDRHLTLEFHGSDISYDGGLLPYSIDTVCGTVPDSKQHRTGNRVGHVSEICRKFLIFAPAFAFAGVVYCSVANAPTLPPRPGVDVCTIKPELCSPSP